MTIGFTRTLVRLHRSVHEIFGRLLAWIDEVTLAARLSDLGEVE